MVGVSNYVGSDVFGLNEGYDVVEVSFSNAGFGVIDRDSIGLRDGLISVGSTSVPRFTAFNAYIIAGVPVGQDAYLGAWGSARWLGLRLKSKSQYHLIINILSHPFRL